MAEQTPPGGEEETRAAPLLEWRRRKADLLAKHPERREFSTVDFEIRESQDGVLRFSGYASVTEQPYEVGFYTETIKRGAFKRTLSENPDVQLLINHGEGGSGMPIARTGRNMSLSEDERGLRVDAQLDPDDPDVQLLARKMKNGLIDQMSFAFQATDQEWNDDYTQRSIRAASIHRGDVSVVNQGANGASTALLRSREALARVGSEGVLEGLSAWREVTLLAGEQREGASPPDVLTLVCELATGDEDEARALVGELMRVGADQVRGVEPDPAPPAVMRAADRQRIRRVQIEQQQRARALRSVK